MPGVNSRHWDTILEALEAGPIEDPSGLATQKLQAVTGHESTNALAKILRRMEEQGLIERTVRGRRTFRIALAPSVAPKQRKRQPVTVTDQVPVVTDSAHDGESVSPGDGIDYDLLAAVLLAKALKATEAQESSAGAKDLQARVERAEAARRIAEADARAARSKAADLEATVRQLEKNMAALQAALGKPQRNQGTPVRDHLDATTRRELDQLMRALPSRR